jgi:diacylglycerol kinase (ATP)
MVTPTPPNAGSALCIVNPSAAGGRALVLAGTLGERLSAQFAGLRVEATQHPHHAAELAARHGGEHAAVVVLGGDGTVSEVARGLLEGGHDPLLVVVPAGSGSDYARNLGITTPEQALAALRDGREVRVDVGTVGLEGAEGPLERPFVLTTGTGFSPAVIRRATPLLKRVCRAHTYTVAGILASLGYRPPWMRWTVDGESGEGRAFNIVVANAELESGGARMSPGARLDDGLLWFGASLGWSALRGLWRMRRIFDGSHTESATFDYRSAHEIRIESDPPVGVQVDGEVPGCTPATFGLLPARLRVLAPAGSQLSRGTEAPVG